VYHFSSLGMDAGALGQPLQTSIVANSLFGHIRYKQNASMCRFRYGNG